MYIALFVFIIINTPTDPTPQAGEVFPKTEHMRSSHALFFPFGLDVGKITFISKSYKYWAELIYMYLICWVKIVNLVGQFYNLFGPVISPRKNLYIVKLLRAMFVCCPVYESLGRSNKQAVK